MAEMKDVVVYDKDLIENLLERIDTEIPVRGIDNMKVIVDIFNTLSKGGTVQQAQVVYPNETKNAEVVEAESFKPADEVVYDATEDDSNDESLVEQ
jgi:hypothetical protein